MKFANIIYNKRNPRITIGDDVQLLSVENLYNYMGIDYSEVIRIPLDACWDYDGEEVVLPVSFPLLSYHGADITCFSPKIHPVFLGICILATELSENDVEYLKQHEPIGCRDYHTYETMKKYGILSYIGGCLTLGFPSRWEKGDKKKVYCIDVTDEFKQYIPSNIIEDCVFVSHTYYLNDLDVIPEEKMRMVYEEYINNARMIITSRMHGALPCIAAGIPVIFAKDEYSYRFSGIDDVARIYTKESYDKIDWNPQPIEYEEKKREIMDFDAKRVWNVYNNETVIDYNVNHLLTPRRTENCYIEFYDNTIEFINQNWGGGVIDDIEYILWGTTQLAKMLYIYIRDNYPGAKLINVIDRVKRDEFCGVCAVAKEEISDFDGKFVFVCTGAAIQESNRFLENKCVYYQCCGDNIVHKSDYYK